MFTPGEALLKSQTHPQMCCCHPVMKEEPRQETDPPHTAAGDPRQQPKVVTCITNPAANTHTRARQKQDHLGWKKHKNQNTG